MIASFKRVDGRGLGFENVGECNGEREREREGGRENQTNSTIDNP
jgi:hypothetical protein